MKLNSNQIPFINLSLFFTILICCALGTCVAHSSADAPSPNADPNIEFDTTTFTSQQASPAEASQFSESEPPFSSFPASEAPLNPTSHESFEDSSSSISFSGIFSDMLKGSLRGHSLTMPHHLSPEARDNHPLEQICGHTDHPDVCVATVSPLLSRGSDVINVLEAAIKACSLQIKLTMDKAAKRATPPEMAAAVAECREQYADALDNLQRAMDAIPSRDLGTVTIMLSAVMADVSTCESGFQDLKSSSLMAHFDSSISIMASNCLAIASSIPY